MAENVNLIKFVNEYDNSPSIGAGFDEKKFDNIFKKLDSKNKEEQQDAVAQIPNRVKNLVKIVSKTVERLNATLGSKFPNMRQLDLEKSITFNASGATGKFEIIQAGDDQHISFNVKKLSMYPALEVSSIVTKSVIDALAKQNNKENDKNFYKSVLLYSQDDAHPKTKDEKDIIKAKDIIAGYLRNFLPAVYADEFDKFVAISDYVAKQIIEDLGEKDIEKILSPFFDLDTLDIQGKSIEKVDAFLGNTHKARINHLGKRAEELLINPETEVLGVSYLEQVQALIGTDTSDPNYSDLARKFNTLANGERCINGPAAKEICEFIVHDFLSKRNIVDAKITYDNKGALGSFYEQEHRININLDKLEKKGSFTELAMTLTHELTHAVDAVKTNGLQNDISEKFVHTTQNEDVSAFMKNLLRLSYKVNPNEKSARLGELYGLMIMTKVGSNNASVKGEIAQSIESFKRYQRTTIEIIQQLPQKLDKIHADLKAFLSSGAIIENSPLYKEIMERIEYISDVGLNVSVEQELESIEMADLMLKGEEGLLEIKRRQEAKQERMTKEENQRRLDEEERRRKEMEEMEESRQLW